MLRKTLSRSRYGYMRAPMNVSKNSITTRDWLPSGPTTKEDHEVEARMAAPHMWGDEPPRGWRIFPSSEHATEEPIPCSRYLLVRDTNAMYKEIGMILAFAQQFELHELTFQWRNCNEFLFSVPQTPEYLPLARYINYRESKVLRGQGNERNVEQRSYQWDRELEQRLDEKAESEFCWALTADSEKQRHFLENVGIQWSNRADYLVYRMSREKKEFRPDVTLKQVIQDGSERRRRFERRKTKEKATADAMKQASSNGETVFTESEVLSPVDMLPREVREAMMDENQGHNDSQMFGGDMASNVSTRTLQRMYGR